MTYIVVTYSLLTPLMTITWVTAECHEPLLCHLPRQQNHYLQTLSMLWVLLLYNPSRPAGLGAGKGRVHTVSAVR